jgi:HSP20 family molecular chaperone IbpA
MNNSTTVDSQTSARGPEIRRDRVFSPSVDILEADDAITLMLDIPGVTDTDIEVTVENGTLSIRAPQIHLNTEGFQALLREYAVGRFERSFRLGSTLDPEGIRAEYRDGVLRLDIPKSKHAVPKRIQINAA